ncbi:hypothetical protein GETHLI_34650 [Geothrix limicola]|uniref:Transporter n=1 Tax=Geothrix limicola TaxID=2927978 RepID=A0ABQ5QJV6_9BACT|nr:hypothetical protein [Geothrix limicola]GLH74963.1 hypothetical protein GETHLI_34650 [Geothrix limicola]
MQKARESFFRRTACPPACSLILLAGGLATRPLEAQSATYLELGGGWRQGDFGTPVRSTLWMGHATFGITGGRWEANLTVPTLSLTREEGGTSSQDQGLGDVVVRGAYRLMPENEAGWSLDGACAIKLPTASETAGLGTGHTDVGGFLTARHRGGAFQWTCLGGWIQASSSTLAGTAETLTPGAYVLGLNVACYANLTRWELGLEARGPALEGAPGAREVSLKVFQPFSSTWGMNVGFTLGLNDGGPRRGADLALVWRFN